MISYSKTMDDVKRHLRDRKRQAQACALQHYRTPYELLKTKLRDLGYVCVGSITRQRLTCGKPSCACHQDRNRRHGPYTYWTRKVAGRTETRLLDGSLVPLYRQGIRNHRKLDALIERMREVSLAAFQAAKIASNR